MIVDIIISLLAIRSKFLYDVNVVCVAQTVKPSRWLIEVNFYYGYATARKLGKVYANIWSRSTIIQLSPSLKTSVVKISISVFYFVIVSITESKLITY